MTFSLGGVTAEGDLLPEAKKVEIGKTVAIPANRTLYIAGKTLTGWTDGTTTYAAGEELTVSGDVTLTPVFTDNTVSLADRTDAVTLNFDFQTKNGAPTMGYQNKAGIYVTQAVVNGRTIDVKLDFDTNNGGKIANANWPDWCQMNSGTKLSVPSCKGAVVSVEGFNELGVPSASSSDKSVLTIDGQTDYTTGKVISYTIANTAETIDVVIGAEGSYYRYVKVVLPVVQSTGTWKEKMLYTTDFTDWDKAAATKTETTVTKKMMDGNDLMFTLYNVAVDPAGTHTKFKSECVTPGYLQTNKADESTAPYVMTSTIADVTKISFVQAATGGKRGVTLYVKGDGDTDWVALHNTAIGNADGELLTYDVNRKNCQFKFGSFALGQNGYILSLEIHGNMLVEGEEYTVSAFAAPVEGGTASVYPKTETYMENDEVTLTATPNFGYHFVNWTDATGSEVSTEAKFKYTVTANAELTANFVAVNTHELKYSVEGGANLYMVQPTPAPVVVDGKNMYEEGTKVTLTASSNPILTFTNWSNGETAAEMAVTMDGNKEFVASYSAIDFIAGWDFYLKGSAGRAADFFAADNDAASIVMRNAAGETNSWLDKSQEAANGYEGRPAAVNWRTTGLGEYYWQTMVNAAAFTDIKVKSAMLYNYNAYTKYDVEYSLDGETWTSVGSHVMEGSKNWNDGEFALPADADNKDKVYIRWIADKTSSVAGTTSDNDGIALGAVYITGKAQLINDGKAPVLVSSVPENNGTGASANGKIVLTFDEKVKLTESAKAMIGTEELVPVVSGKTVICEYKGLNYSTEYTFTLAGNSVADLTDNVLADAITIMFSTKDKPVVEKKLYDFVVGTDGTIEAAFAAANAKGKSNTERFRVFIPEGSYVIPASATVTKTVTVELAGGTKQQKTFADPTTYLSASNISFIGVDYNNTVITNTCPEEEFNGKNGVANVSEGIGNSDVISNTGTLNYFQGLTIKTSMGDAKGRDIALNDKGNKTVFKDACLWGYQDTYVSNSDRGKFYFEGGVIRGRTDYLCGKGDVYYNEVTLQQCGTGGYLSVPSVPKKYGYVFNNCYIKKETSDVTFYLGRPWGSGTPIACFINTKMDGNAIGNGWADMSGGYPKRFAEYNSYLTSGTQIDLSGRRTSWKDKEGNDHPNDPILTIEEVNSMSLANVMGQDDDWDPTALTEQASAPTNVQYTSTTLTWDNSKYVLGWVVFKNGKYVANVIEPEYAIDDATATWSVRAANEMGGLGEATVATVATGIDEITGADNENVASTSYYNLQGVRVSKDYKGVVIKVDTMLDGKQVSTKIMK